MAKLKVWHNTRGEADQYFLCRGVQVYCQLPKWLARLLMKLESEEWE